jgi:hypothetical protein
MLWIDKYSPKCFETLQCHSHLTFVLSRLAQTKEIPHLLFYGPPGGGKKTRIMVLLHALFGDSVYKVGRKRHCQKSTWLILIIILVSSLYITVCIGKSGIGYTRRNQRRIHLYIIHVSHSKYH